MADGGTLFLDEIGDISSKLQMDLLRVLQERKFYRVGGTEEIEVEVRVIAATNLDLDRAVREGKFRDDLFYRLNVISIQIPPLRERREDIPLLARSFVERISHELGKKINGISEGALRILMDHEWPGNVRELENTIERAIVTCKTMMLADEDVEFLIAGRDQGKAAWNVPANITLEEAERDIITATVERSHGNIKEAASILGIDRSTLYDRLKKYNVQRE
jgi:transcriptional regulator with PAS, ATPase and Fis domain